MADNASYEAARNVIAPGANVSEATTKALEVLSLVGIRNATITVSPNPILE